MYDDKYENFFLNITAGRSRFAEFASFTATTLQGTKQPAALAALAQPLAQALQAFVAAVATRTAGSGSAQGGTRTDDATWQEFKAFVQATDKTLVQPAYYNQPADLLAYYPDKLGGLTQAPKKLRLPRLLAYVQALQTHNKDIAKAAGSRAAQPLAQYQAATASKEAGNGQVQATIATLDPAQVTLCQQLWAVHCTALYVHQANPRLAAALFDYSLLPQNKPAARPTAPK